MKLGDLLRLALSQLESMGISHMVVGSFASGAHGEPRLTHDIDIVIDPTPEQLRALCAAFPREDFYVSIDAAMDALARRSQFNVIHPESGNKIDFMIAGTDPWHREQMRRRQRLLLLPDQEGYVARPEDIIISKMTYYAEGGSEKHLRDITGILRVSGDAVDRAYVERWAGELGVTEVWQAILRRLNSP